MSDPGSRSGSRGRACWAGTGRPRRGGAGQHSWRSGPAVEHGIVSVRSATDEVEARRACVDVQSGHAERVVVVPDRRGPVLVRVLEDGGAGRPADAIGPGGLGREEVEPGAVPGVPRWDVLGRRQVPRLRVAVAVVRHAYRAVDVGDHRHGPRVRAGRLRRTWAASSRSLQAVRAGSPNAGSGRPGADAAGSPRSRPQDR